MKERGFRHGRGAYFLRLCQAAPKHISDGAHYTNKKNLVKYWYAVRRLLGLRLLGLFCVTAINWRVNPRTANIV